MKVHLVFPPVWLTEIPYLSVPALRAVADGIPGIHAKSLDLNIQLWIHLRGATSLRAMNAWAIDKLSTLDVVESRHDLDTVLQLRAIADNDADSLVEKVGRRQLPTPVIQSCVKMYFKEVVMRQPEVKPSYRWQHDRIFHDPYLNSISLSEYAQDAQQLLASLELNESENPYLKLMPMLYGQLVGDELPDVLGVSVTAVNQVTPAMALSHYVKSTKPDCRIIWGGQWVTHVIDKPQELAPIFDIVDGIVVGEGEIPLQSLLKCELAGASWDTVPNLFRRIDGEVVPPSEFTKNPDLNHLPTPVFDGIPLQEFDYPGTLPLQTSRGCSWNQCRFCSYIVLDPVYKERSVDLVTDDIQALMKRHAVTEFAFTDAIMDPVHFTAVSDEILARRIRVNWRGFGRFDRRFTAATLDKMARAGCVFIIWGMESGSNRILHLMRKGTNREISRQNLGDAARSGIHNRVCLIYGYPGETVEDRDLTVGFLRDNLNAVHSMAFSPLQAERGTPVADGPESEQFEAPERPTGLQLEVLTSPSTATLDYLRETEQSLRSIHLALERRHVSRDLMYS